MQILNTGRFDQYATSAPQKHPAALQTERAIKSNVDLEILHPLLKSSQRRYLFPNGYGASVVSGLGFLMPHENQDAIYEVAVLLQMPEYANTPHGTTEITYDTPITNDVIKHLTWQQRDKVLQQIFDLPKPTDEELMVLVAKIEQRYFELQELRAQLENK